MKRIGNLYEQIISIENLKLVDEKARKGKRQSYGVIIHDKNREANIIELNKILKEKTFKTSRYNVFKVYEPKEREIYQLPYFPDRIVHHAVMNLLEPIWVSIFTADTYSCIKGKGIHAAVKKIKHDLKDLNGTQYCLKLDIRKFYPTIDHVILKRIIRKKIKDADLLELLDKIIDSANGVPIGNYLSQYFTNLYMAYLDHHIKEVLQVKFYYRYADDMVVLSGSKAELWAIFAEIKTFLTDNLNIEIKSNYQIFPVSARGIDFLGYVFYHTHVLLRKTIKKRLAKSFKKPENNYSFAAYWGWCKHCNSINLLNKLCA